MNAIAKVKIGIYAFLAGLALLVVTAAAQTETAEPASDASEKSTIAQILAAEPGNPHTIALKEMAGFEVLPDTGPTSAMLTDGSFENGDPERQPTMLILSSDSEAEGAVPDDVELFAAVMMYLTEDLFKKIKVKDTRPMTIAGLSSAEVFAKAKGFETGEKIKIVQWMLFSTDGRFIRIIGYAPRDQFDAALPRFEQVRDGLVIDP